MSILSIGGLSRTFGSVDERMEDPETKRTDT